MIYEGDEAEDIEYKAEIIWALFSLKSKGLIKDFEITEAGFSVEFPDDMCSDDRNKHLSRIPNFTAH
jgi:hypothetical protein